jgi:hypothetical protein
MCERFVEIMCVLLADNSYSDNVRKQLHNCYVCKVLVNVLGSKCVISRGLSEKFIIKIRHGHRRY